MVRNSDEQGMKSDRLKPDMMSWGWTPGPPVPQDDPTVSLTTEARWIKALPSQRKGKSGENQDQGKRYWHSLFSSWHGGAETSPHWKWPLGGWWEDPCVLGYPRSHLILQSESYSWENSLSRETVRVKSFLILTPVCGSICHSSPFSRGSTVVLPSAENVCWLPPQHISSTTFTIFDKNTKRNED